MYKLAGINISGFDFGCDTTVNFLLFSSLSIKIYTNKSIYREHATYQAHGHLYSNTMALTGTYHPHIPISEIVNQSITNISPRAGQMQHFVKNDNLNVFRLPVRFLSFIPSTYFHS